MLVMYMYKKYIKRVLDIIISIILLIILFPIIIIVYVITFFDLGLPLHNIVREREGINKKTFIMYKIRTKILPDNKEYTRISYIIDRLRLNELPQLINVIKGDMSLVGPRPFIPNDKLPDGVISEKRYLVRPGITGLAQVNGGRSITHKEKLEYDIIYYDNSSFILDLKIIIKTIVLLFKGL